MTTTRLADNREYQQMSVEDADKLFSRIAVLTAKVDRSAADTEKRIADLKAAHENRTADDREELKELVAGLTEYIGAHPARFLKPRQHKTPFGRYGLRSVTDVRIVDEQFVMAFSDEHQLALYTVTRKVEKTAVAKAIAERGEVPGAKIVAGDVASYTVDKSVLNQQPVRD